MLNARTGKTFAIGAVVVVALLSCKKERLTPSVNQPGYINPVATGYGTPGQPGYGYPAPQPGYPPPVQTGTPPVATAPPAPVAMAPAMGLFCWTDQDIQCPFGRCVGGRCGGCSTVADCKPGSSCVPSPVGTMCLGAGAPATPTAAPPTATVPVVVPPPVADRFAAARAQCIQRLNEYRAKAGVAPVAVRGAGEPCGDDQARRDSASGKAHGAFGLCKEMAQNECPGWPGTVEQVVDGCLKMMFEEGPGEGSAHGHYTNMVNPSYTAASCGFFVMPDGSVWAVQDFYPATR